MGVGRRRRPSGEERVGKLKNTPRRSWTGGASRTGGGTGKAGHEVDAKGVYDGRARRADERTGELGRKEGEQEVTLERVQEVDVRRRIVRLSVEVQENGSRIRRR